jgi:hypothetical protein
MRALMRLALWGTSAAAALLVAALASYPNLPAPPLVALAVSIAKGPVEGADERRQLAETVRAFQAEREALLARISALEQNLEDTTGSNRGASASVRSAAPAAAAPPPLAMETTPVPILAWPVPAFMAAQILAPPINRLANLPAIEAIAEPTPVRAKAEFGIDLGSAVNFDALRVLWNSTKIGHADHLDGLVPLVLVRENGKSRAMELRLIVGPLPDTQTAQKLCAALAAVYHACQLAPYDGQKFAESTPEPESKSTPVSLERRPARTPSLRPPAKRNP